MILLTVFAASLSILSPFSHAALVPLFEKESAAVILPGYETSVNHSPAFYVWQNDPLLSDYFDPKGVSPLCIPATISNLMLYEFSRQTPRMDQLKLAGLSDDQQSVETSTLVKDFVSKCGYTTTYKSISMFDASRCLAQKFSDSGYPHTSVKLIRNMGPLTSPLGVNYENRVPELLDLKDALTNGSEVIAVIAFMKWDPIQKIWVKKGSHAINIFGYSWNKDDSDLKITVYISNPTRHYEMNFKTPLNDIASLEFNQTLKVQPAPYSSIEIGTIQGTLLNFEGLNTFLAGLLIVKPEATSLEPSTH